MFAFFQLVALLVVSLWALAIARRNRREVARLRERVANLERRLSPDAVLAAVPRPDETEAPAPLPEPIPFARPTSAAAARAGGASTPASPAEPPSAAVPASATSAPAPPAEPPSPVVVAPAPAAPAAAPAAPAAAAARPPAPAGAGHAAPATARRFDSSRVEQLVGGIWLQNVGSVLLLLGVFFLILWGYTTGRIGPAVLVAAGAALGAALAWRGNAIARSLPAFGHALIGLGLGVIYLSLYLGHFTLHVLPTTLALALLTVVSLASVAIGLRCRAQTVAALGVLGAFIPQLIAAWIPMRGFSLPPYALLGYFAFVDLVVFALAATAGWSALDLAALLLTTATWTATFPGASWGWGTELGLCALFVLLGLAPLPRLTRIAGRVRNRDLAVVVLAPLCLVAVSWPFLAYTDRVPVAGLLIALAALFLTAALWVDARRPERDLWRPLTGAAILFLTAALERAIGHENTPMAWTVEGAVLVWLGVNPRGGWLRFSGQVVLALGTVWLAARLLTPGSWTPEMLPVFHAAALRDLVCLAALVAAAAALGRHRAHLGRGERRMTDAWTIVANVLFAVWSGREASHVARSFEESGGRWTGLPPVGGASTAQRTNALTMACASLGWFGQAGVLLRLGLRPDGKLLQRCGHAAAALGAVLLAGTLIGPDAWTPGRLPVLHPVGIVGLIGAAGLIAGSAFLARRREHLSPGERSLPEQLTASGNVLLLFWLARESGHLARALLHAQGAGVSAAAAAVEPLVAGYAAAFACALWLAQAMVLLGLGLRGKGRLLRTCAYAIAGITVLRLLAAMVLQDSWRPGALPVLHFAGLVNLGCVGGLVLIAAWLGRRRERLGANEWRIQQIATVLANVAMLTWAACEAAHLAQALAGAAGAEAAVPAAASGVRTLAAVFTSAAWTLQAGALLALGWTKGSAFVRWLGLGLFGLTVFKFLLFDLQQVDVFWRFLTAIVVGAALLGVSYFYQRRNRPRAEPPASA